VTQFWSDPFSFCFPMAFVRLLSSEKSVERESSQAAT
jgi:hypothetical protein